MTEAEEFDMWVGFYMMGGMPRLMAEAVAAEHILKSITEKP